QAPEVGEDILVGGDAQLPANRRKVVLGHRQGAVEIEDPATNLVHVSPCSGRASATPGLPRPPARRHGCTPGRGTIHGRRWRRGCPWHTAASHPCAAGGGTRPHGPGWRPACAAARWRCHGAAPLCSAG